MFVFNETVAAKPRHHWLRPIRAAFVPGTVSPLMAEMIAGLKTHLVDLGNEIQDVPDDTTDVVLTTAPYGTALTWRKALFFTVRQRYKLSRQPTMVSMVHITPAQLDDLTKQLQEAIAKEPPDPEDFEFPGLAPGAYRVLVEQGRRGGPILAVQRLLQVQAMSLRVLLAVGDQHPEAVYHFDLVGAYPVTRADQPADFYQDIVLRLATSVCAQEVNHHEVQGLPVPYELWRSLSAPSAMIAAANQLGKRSFFTNMVRIADLVHVPAVGAAVAEQYSEGCFATWDPQLQALIATVTGSARPVDKANIAEDDLAVIVGVRPDRQGALVRPVEGKGNDPPSTEAVELMDMDATLPRIALGASWPVSAEVPVVRSKLHGHRGVASYDPSHVEYVPLADPFFHYLVTCGTDAQANAVKDAFSRSQALRNLDDPRQIAFTILPGHGVIMAEKWVAGKEPFQILWEAMDDGRLRISSHVPQGPMHYVPSADGSMVLQEGVLR